MLVMPLARHLDLTSVRLGNVRNFGLLTSKWFSTEWYFLIHGTFEALGQDISTPQNRQKRSLPSSIALLKMVKVTGNLGNTSVRCVLRAALRRSAPRPRCLATVPEGLSGGLAAGVLQHPQGLRDLGGDRRDFGGRR